jgi:hypothetical protein
MEDIGLFIMKPPQNTPNDKIKGLERRYDRKIEIKPEGSEKARLEKSLAKSKSSFLRFFYILYGLSAYKQKGKEDGEKGR